MCAHVFFCDFSYIIKSAWAFPKPNFIQFIVTEKCFAWVKVNGMRIRFYLIGYFLTVQMYLNYISQYDVSQSAKLL